MSLALSQVTEQKDEREQLVQRRALLRAKLEILQKGGSGFSRDMGPQDRATLQTRLEEVEGQLAALGPVHEILQSNLDIVAGVLADAGKQLWGEVASLRLDNHFVLHGDDDTAVPATALTVLRDSNGRQLTVALVTIPV